MASTSPDMRNWTFLTSHARVLRCIACHRGARLRDIAASLGISERSAYAISTDLTEAGYIATPKVGRRNRYQIQVHRRSPDPTAGNAPSARWSTSWSARVRCRVPGEREADVQAGSSSPRAL